MELAVKKTLQWFAQLGRAAWQSSLADKLAEWLSGSIAGKISVGVFAYLLLRSPLDSLWRRIHGYPPGTIGLVPFFSTLLGSIDAKNLQRKLIQENDNYGPISMHIAGPVKFVYLNTREACEIAFKKDRLVNRYLPRSEEEFRQRFEYLKPMTGTLSFMIIDGIRWKIRRKLMLNTVNLDGAVLDSVVEDSINQLISRLNEDISGVSSISWNQVKKDLLFLTFSTIYRSSFGLYHFPTKEELQRFMVAVKDFLDFLFVIVFAVLLPPWMGLRFGHLMGGKLIQSHQFGHNLMLKWLDKYQDENVDENRRYVHTLIEEVETEHMSRDEAAADMILAFAAASHSTASTLEDALINAAAHPDYQNRICDELKQAFSDRSEITLKRVQMECPFLQAFAYEIIRLSTVALHTAPRVCPEDTEVLGYTIPKGSTVIANTMCIAREKEEWPDIDPLRFDPRRWMIDDHTLIEKKMDKLPIFGFGHRQCPGKNLAVRHQCVLLAHLMYEYEFSFSDPLELKPLWFLDWQSEDTGIRLQVQKRAQC